jgi:hypothetical protein
MNFALIQQASSSSLKSAIESKGKQRKDDKNNVCHV